MMSHFGERVMVSIKRSPYFGSGGKSLRMGLPLS